MNTNTLAIFDLDFTLLDGDCEMMWSEFLVRRGLLPQAYIRQFEAFNQEYELGHMDFPAYAAFIRQPFTEIDPQVVENLRAEYLLEVRRAIRPYMLDRLDWHMAQQHELIVITCANRYLAGPIVEAMGIRNLIGTSLELRDGQFVADLNEEAPFREGKVHRLLDWATSHGFSMQQTWGFSDSQNDLPLLERVSHPVAVTPDATLRAMALQREWEIIEA